MTSLGTSLVVQWLRLPAPNAGSLGSVLAWGNWILQLDAAAKSSHAQLNI